MTIRSVTGLSPILGSLVYTAITIVYPGPARRVIPHPSPIGNQRAIGGHQRESTRSRRGHWDDVGEGPLLPQLNCRWIFKEKFGTEKIGSVDSVYYHNNINFHLIILISIMYQHYHRIPLLHSIIIIYIYVCLYIYILIILFYYCITIYYYIITLILYIYISSHYYDVLLL